jgi:hypothetical protein
MTTLAAAKRAIQDIYSDTSVSRGKTRSRLEELREEIDMLLDTLSDSETEDDE